MVTAPQVATRNSKGGLVFKGMSFYDHDFSKENLVRADFRWAILHGCNFDNCDLSYTDFEGADCTGASFRQAKLYRTSFKNAVLAEAVMDPRDMFGTTLTVHCNTVERVKVGPIWMAGWLQYMLMMDMPAERKEKIRALAEEIVGAERFKAIERTFCSRDI